MRLGRMRMSLLRQDTWVPHTFCRAGPVCPAVGAGNNRSGRCGERTERCQWQRKRSERVAAVKISSVRRKAAQKFWAPQQDHRPLRNRIMGCVGEGLCPSRGRPQGSPLRKRNKRRNERATARVAPTEGYRECDAVRNPPFLRPFKIIFSSLLLSMQRMCFSGHR